MISIKICGITRLEDAVVAARAGADALGFIFYERSPRYIDPAAAKAIIDALPDAAASREPGSGGILASGRDRITAVGVFVNRTAAEICKVATFCGLDLVQLHGDESAEFCNHFPRERLIKAVSPKMEMDLDGIGGFAVRAILIDAHDPLRYGGTGRTSDWTLAAKAGRIAPLILSGGLHAGNVREAMRAVRPDAIDICSGVEAAPGIKDHEKLRDTIDTIRKEDRGQQSC